MLDCHKKSVCRKDYLCLVCNEKNKASCSFKCSNWFVKQIWLLQRCLRQLRHRPMWKTTDWTPKPRSPDFIICTEAMRTILTSCFRHSAGENQEITKNLWSLAKTYSSKTSSHIYYDVQTSIWIYPWISSVSTYTPKWYNFVLSEEFQEKIGCSTIPNYSERTFSYRGAMLWNSLSHELQSTVSSKGGEFRSKVRHCSYEWDTISLN